MLEFIRHFVGDYSAQQIIIGILGAVLAIFPSINILQWLKEKTGWVDSKMHTAVVAFFGVLALLIMVVTGALDPSAINWTFDSVAAYWGSFALIGEAAYQFLKARGRI